MDKIYINDLEIFAFHGVIAEEKALGQKFVLSIELDLNLREAGKTDDLTKTVHYGELCEKVENHFNAVSYDLIEKAAEEIAKLILTSYPLVDNVKILLKKPWAPIKKPLKYVAVEVTRGWHKAYIAGGSNLEDKRRNLEEAIKLLNEREDCKVTKVSNYYDTAPIGYTEQDDFVNCAFELKTLLSPSELMDVLLDIEKVFKRERIIKWGPRTLDLDIIFYDDIISDNEKYIIPHPRAHERQFVLEPLCDINKYYMHPLLKKRVIDLCNDLESK